MGEPDASAADDVFAVLEDLVDEGKVRAYGWNGVIHVIDAVLLPPSS